MKIGVLVNIGYTLDAFFREMVAEWESEGHSVFTLAGSKSVHFDNDVRASITRRPTVRNLTASFDIAQWCRRHDLDFLITSNATTSALARLRKMPVPVVYFCHGLHWNQGESASEKFWQMLERRFLANTHSVLCMNSDDHRWFQEHFREDRIFHLENGVGVPLDQFQPSTLPETEPLNLLWAGEFSDRKRPELMLDVAKSLLDRGMDFHLTMAGKGSLQEEMRQKARSLDLSDRVDIPGHISLPEYLDKCHLLVHTSQWEGLPRVMLEARAMRRQSVAFDVKGSRDIPDALLVADWDTTAFADEVEKLGTEILQSHQTLPPVSPEMDSAYVAKSIVEFLGKVLNGKQ